MEYRRRIIASSPHPSHAEGAVASFPDGTDLPLKSLIVNIDPVQSGSGDPSPTNIRPIGGWDAVVVHDTGINLWDEEWELGEINTNTGVNGTSTTRSRSKNYIPIVPTESYYCHGTAAMYLFFYDKDKNYLGFNGTNRVNRVITPAELVNAKDSSVSFSSAKFMRFRYDTTSAEGVSINYPSTDHDYHPYTGTSLTVQLGRTVYGCTLNPLTGELVVDRAMVDLGTLTWTYSNRFFRANPNPEYKRPSSQRSTINALCTIYKNTTWNDVGSGDNEYAFSSAVTKPEVIIKNSSYTDATAFKTAMSGVMLCYELAEPITYTLDPQTVRSLVGNNNIFADTGNVALEYWAHP